MGMDCFNLTMKPKCENCGKRDCQHQSWFACTSAEMRDAANAINQQFHSGAALQMLQQQPLTIQQSMQQALIQGQSTMQWTDTSGNGRHAQQIQGASTMQWTSPAGSFFHLDANLYSNWSPAHVVKRSEIDQLIWELRQRVDEFKL